MLILVAFYLPTVEAYEGVLLSYPLRNQVTVDGKWTNQQEWSDASQVRLLPATGYFAGNKSMTPVDARICLKHDENTLYILVDFISDHSVEFGWNNPDSAWFYLDTLGNGGNKMQEDDIVMLMEWIVINGVDTPVLKFLEYGVEGKVKWSIDGASFGEVVPAEGMQAASSSDPSNDQFSSSPHVIYEISIPRSMFKGTGDPGILFHLQDHNSADPKDYEQTIFADFPYRGPKSGLNPNQFFRIQFQGTVPAESTTTATSASTSSVSSTPAQTSTTQTATTSQGSGFSFSSIPGFPVEAIFIGLVSGLVALTLIRRRSSR
jgi:hypothetical protein